MKKNEHRNLFEDASQDALKKRENFAVSLRQQKKNQIIQERRRRLISEKQEEQKIEEKEGEQDIFLVEFKQVEENAVFNKIQLLTKKL